MCSQLLIGCSGWNYPDPPERGGVVKCILSG